MQRSPINGYVQQCLEDHAAASDHDRTDVTELDLTGPDEEWTKILQEIVRRSQTLDEIVVTTSFTCTKMRPDGFGGSLMRIAADAIQYASTVQMLEDIRNRPGDTASSIDDGEHEIRRRIEGVAQMQGWDSFTLLLLISRWLGQSRQTDALISFLEGLVAHEDAEPNA